jgi:hypothetical protein
MGNLSRGTAAISYAVAVALALGAACTLNPSIPNARVVCDPAAPKCPSGFSCERIEQASVPIGICCRMAGCSQNLTPEQIGGIVDAGVGSGLIDAGADGATCVEEACTTNPGAPCVEGRIKCGSDSRTCMDGPKARDGTLCGSNGNMICVNGTCGACTAGTACTTNSDQCTNGVVVCSPAGCSNGTTKSPGASCGTGQVCSAAGTCIPCASGAACATNSGAPCSRGAIACSTGAPQCLDSGDAPDGTNCGIDRVCKTGACTSCVAGTVCTGNPGGMCKLGVVACGTASGCIDGENVGAGAACGSNMVCNGNGLCVMCEAGKACTTNPGAPCKTGVTECTTGAPKCVDTGNTAAGTTCGTNQVCNGSGTCVTCMAGTTCTTNPSICRNGMISCETGAPTCVDGTNKPSTATCPGGPMCDGNGFCGACVAGQTCTSNPTACKQGTTTCGTTTTCTDGANRAAGTSCGVGMVCNGSAVCVPCASGQSCSTNPGPCKTGTTSCSTGAQTCVDGSNKPGGTGCGMNMVCNSAGACVACTANENCNTNPTACKTGVTSCMTGAPVCLDFGNRSPGTSCGAGMVCDGSGACRACTAGQTCTGNPNPCYNGTTSCMSGTQVCVDGTMKAAGTGCGTNQVCNANGQCMLCTAGQTCTTNPRAACVNGISACGTGVQTCVDDTNKAAGTSCGTNMVCNGSGTCVACTAGSGCATNPNLCKNGMTSCMTGASTCVDGPGNVMAGVSCGSNRVCDGAGFCGACTEGQSCTGNPGICYNGVASCMSGSSMCVNGTPKAGGTNCGTNMVCNGSGTCISCTAGTACTSNPNLCKNGMNSCMTGAMTCVDGGNKAPGVSCGTNMVCNGTGTCVACAAGGSCTGNPNICKNGTNSCMTGAMTCVDGGNKAPGTSCGTNMVCNGTGTCVACTAGGSCTGNPSICKNGTNSCMTGAMTCVDGGDKAPGLGCGTNMVCNGSGACVPCTAGGSCTGNPNICKNGTNSCMTGGMTCADGSNKTGGTSCGTNMVCDGNGTCGACTPNQTCASNPNPCYTGITNCMSGTMTCLDNAPRGAGTPCGTNMVCNSANVCVPCAAGASCTTNPNTCRDGRIDCSTGAALCLDGPNKTNGTGCNDGNNCTRTDICTNGNCGGTAYNCPLPGPGHFACQSNTCNGSGGCILMNINEGQPCFDCCVGSGAGATCNSGSCTGGGCCNSVSCCNM